MNDTISIKKTGKQILVFLLSLIHISEAGFLRRSGTCG